MLPSLDFKRTIRDLADLEVFWKDVLPLLKDRCVLLMSGDVGAGKTTSVQTLARILGLRDVQSPSFAIHLRYENAQGFGVDHLDLYRLKDDDDLESSGFWDLFAQKKSLIVVEWADRLNYEYVPIHWQRVEMRFSKISETERVIACREITTQLEDL